MGPSIEPPSITISSIRLEDQTVLEQHFMAALRIQNPNPVDLAIEGVSYDLEVNGQPFAKGVGKGPGALSPLSARDCSRPRPSRPSWGLFDSSKS